MTEIPNRVHARCRTTRRVLVSGPAVAPAALKWVDLSPAHRHYAGFLKAPNHVSENEAYLTAIRASLEASTEDYDD